MPTYEDLSTRLNKLHISWFDAMKAGKYEAASFFANDLVELASRIRRESFIQLDLANDSKASPKPSSDS